MNKEEAIDLLNRYYNGTCSEQEKLLVEQAYNEQVSIESLPDDQIDYVSARDTIFQRLMMENAGLKQATMKLKKLNIIRTAAAVLLLLGIGGATFWTIHLNNHPGGSPQSLTADISPAGQKATLTLANGKQINLDEARQGNIASAPGITILKTDSGKIIYSVSESTQAQTTADELNIITTPKGGQFELVLEDGTKVWLNADSKITFPASFKQHKERLVTISGEAYFEVAHNPKKPFSVRSTEQLVTVTGTHFNVSCYPNEPLHTTLAEGSVVVFQPKTGARKSLKPGYQSTLTSDGILVKEVNPADVIAWKDDLFVFIQTPLSQALAEIARWYNVEIDYTRIPDENFDGEISRRLPLSQVLKVIEISNNIKFQRTGRIIKAI